MQKFLNLKSGNVEVFILNDRKMMMTCTCIYLSIKRCWRDEVFSLNNRKMAILVFNGRKMLKTWHWRGVYIYIHKILSWCQTFTIVRC